MNDIGKARIQDVPQIHKLVNHFADKGEMLARPLSEIYESIRDFIVAMQGEEVVACAALHVCWSDLAEIRSVAVTEVNQKQGLGSHRTGIEYYERQNYSIINTTRKTRFLL